MHELSIAMGIVDTATSELDKHEGMEIEAIELEIGLLAGLEIDAFEFAWPLAIKDSALENAQRITHLIKGKAICQECDTEFEKTQLFDACPKCGGFFHTITAGKELKIKSITLSENTTVQT